MSESLENGKGALQTQHGGDHYKKIKIQPVEYAVANQMGPLEFSVLKYITRHGAKDKEQDLKKALHFCQLALKLLYGIDSKVEYIEPKKEEHDKPAS